MKNNIIIIGLIVVLFIGVVFSSGCTTTHNGDNKSNGSELVECITDEDCDDGNVETRDRCIDGKCLYAMAPIPLNPI